MTAREITRAPAKRVRKGKVTKADYERAAEFLRSMGVTADKIASVVMEPGKIRITTTDGAGLTLGDEEETLDRELKEHVNQRYGHG